MSVRVSSPAHLRRLAAGLISAPIKGDVILLRGNVGAGKTTFAREIVWAAQSTCPIRDRGGATRLSAASPTFVRVMEHPFRVDGDSDSDSDSDDVHKNPRMISHIDLHRVSSQLEIARLDLVGRAFRDVAVVEWPERLSEFSPETLPDEFCLISISTPDDGDTDDDCTDAHDLAKTEEQFYVDADDAGMDSVDSAPFEPRDFHVTPVGARWESRWNALLPLLEPIHVRRTGINSDSDSDSALSGRVQALRFREA